MKTTEATITVEEALAELREMFPRCWVYVSLHQDGVLGPKQKLDIVSYVEIQADNKQGVVYNDTAPTLADGMAQVRAWKQENRG